MRISFAVLLLTTMLSLHAQTDYSLAEVEAFAAVSVESMAQINAEKNDPPPGFDSSGISSERYGEIIRTRMLGGELELSARDTAALKIISSEIAKEEERRLLLLLDKYGMSRERHRELSGLLGTDKEFTAAYHRAVIAISQNKVD